MIAVKLCDRCGCAAEMPQQITSASTEHPEWVTQTLCCDCFVKELTEPMYKPRDPASVIASTVLVLVGLLMACGIALAVFGSISR